MRRLELYLDESGQFIDEKEALNPSLIGGILVEKDRLTTKRAQEIMEVATKQITGNYVHINDISKIDKKISGDVSIEIIKQIRKIPANIVIFENNEMLDFNDDKILYLNIISEGIVNLLERLSIERPEGIELNVIAAVRRDLKVHDDRTIIEYEEYSKRIKEKIYMKIAEKNIFLSKDCKVNFELSSARKNAKLMLADVVCNSRLTRNSSKFNNEQKEFLEQTFNSQKYMFNVFRTDLQKKISAYLIQNNIADAIFLINECDDEQKKKQLASLIVNNINLMPMSNLKIQLELLSLKIKSLINVHRNLILCEKLLINIQTMIIPKIKLTDYVINKLILDVSLYLLTIYTHLGDNVHSKEQIQISNKILEKISGSFEYFDYYNILKIREAIYYNTCFNHEKTVEVMTDFIQKNEAFIKAITEITGAKDIKSDSLAKAVGTRLQAYTCLITPSTDSKLKDEYYKKGIEDSNFAIEQFISKSDKQRQYQYRCMLEISYGNLDEAIKYLMKIFDLNGTDFKEFIEKLANVTDYSKYFILVDYLEIMQFAKNNGKERIADEMFSKLKDNLNVYSQFAFNQEESTAIFENKAKSESFHPIEFIYWDFAKYFKKNNKYLANLYYDMAIRICSEMNETTMEIIKISIIADRLEISEKILEDKANIMEIYDKIMNNKLEVGLHEFLDTLKGEFANLRDESDIQKIKTIGKKISEKIKI